jgi:hypothetical protein
MSASAGKVEKRFPEDALTNPDVFFDTADDKNLGCRLKRLWTAPPVS